MTRDGCDPSELPRGWIAATLGDLGHYHNGRGFKKVEWSTQGRPIIRIQNLTTPGRPFNYYDGSDVDDRNVVRGGDILVSWAATLDAFRWPGPEAVVNQHIFKVESCIDQDFHYWVLKSVIADLYRQSHGGGMIHVTRARFTSTPVLLPPLGEQSRIAARIAELYEMVDRGGHDLRKAEIDLNDLRGAVRVAALTGRLSGLKPLDVPLTPPTAGVTLPDLPEGWGWKKVGDLAADEPRAITDGPFGSNLKTEHYTTEGPRVIRLQNVGDDIFNDERAHISEERFQLLKAHEAKQDDVVVAGLGEVLPRACVVPPDVGPAVVKADCFRIRVGSLIHPRLLSAALNSALARAQASRLIAGIGRPRLNLQKLKALWIPVPPEHLQQQVLDSVTKSDEAIRRLAIELTQGQQQAEQLRRAILHAGLNGTLLQQDPADEPVDDYFREPGNGRRAETSGQKR